jgi:Concanavalin A-like lectin/glucanases superfamily
MSRTNRLGGCTVLGLALGLGLAGCKEDPAGVRIDLKVEREDFRPEYIKFNWLRPGRTTYEERLPDQGDLAPSGELIGSLFIETVGPLRDARALTVRGFRGTKEVAGGLLYIHPATAAQRYLELKLAAPLPDGDGNGVPDVLELNCFPNPAGTACATAEMDAARGDAAARDAAASGPDAAEAGADTNSTPPVEADLIGWWRFDESDAAVITDSSGLGNHGTPRGTRLAWLDGRMGGDKSLEIPDVANHGVTVPASASVNGITTAFTIAAWIYRTDQRPGLASILARRSTGTSEHFALAISGDGLPRIYLNSHARPSITPVTGPNEVPMKEWIHLAATYDGAHLRLFVGGAEVNEAPVTTTINATDSFLCIGCGQNEDEVVTEPLAGRLDDLRLYRRALGPGEIALLAHQ